MSNSPPVWKLSDINDFKKIYLQKSNELGLSPHPDILKYVKDVANGVQAFDRIELKEKGFDDESVQPLIAALKKNTTIKDIVLSFNMIKDLHLFKQLLEENETIEGLDLSYNHFSEDSAIKFADFLQKQTDIKWFNLNTVPQETKRIPEQFESLQICLSPQFRSANLTTEEDNYPEDNLTDELDNELNKQKKQPKSAHLNSANAQNPIFDRKEKLKEPRSARKKLTNNSSPQRKERNRKGYKSEVKPKKKYFLSPYNSDSRSSEEKRMLMSRVEWMLQIQEIFHKLVLEFDENVFHKNLIIQRIKDNTGVFPLMEEDLYDMAHLDKGYSLNQVTKAIADSEKTYMRYDDVIEKISIIGKNKSLLEDISLIPASARNLTSRSITYNKSRTEGNEEFMKRNMSLPLNQLLRTSDNIECSFSFDHIEPVSFSRDLQNLNLKPLNLNFKRSGNHPSPKGTPDKKKNPLDNSIQLETEEGRSLSSFNQTQRNSGISTEIGTFTKVTPNATRRQNSYSQNQFESQINIQGEYEEGFGYGAKNSSQSGRKSSPDTDNYSRKSHDKWSNNHNNKEEEEEDLELISEIRENSPGKRNNSPLKKYSKLTTSPISGKKSNKSSGTKQGAQGVNGIREYLRHESPIGQSESYNSEEETENEPEILEEVPEQDEEFSHDNERGKYLKHYSPYEAQQSLETQIQTGTRRTLEHSPQLSRNHIENAVKTTEGNYEEDNILRRSGEVKLKGTSFNELERMLADIRRSVETDVATPEELEVLHQIPSFKLHCINNKKPIASFTYDSTENFHFPPADNPIFINLLKHAEAIRVTNIIDFQSNLSFLWHSNIMILNLAGNDLISVDFISHLNQLQFLNLNQNRIAYFPPLSCSNTLRELYLAHNKLVQVSNIQRFQNLSLLDLSFNSINSYEALSNLSLNKKLQILNLRGNPITQRLHYLDTMNSILSHIQSFDVFHQDLSDFHQYGEVCFASIKVLPQRNYKPSRSTIQFLETTSQILSPNNSVFKHSKSPKKGRWGSISIQSPEKKLNITEASRIMSVSELLASHKKVAPSKAMLITKEQPAKREKEKVYGRDIGMSGQEYARVVGGFNPMSVQKNLRPAFKAKKDEGNVKKNVKIVQVSIADKKNIIKGKENSHLKTPSVSSITGSEVNRMTMSSKQFGTRSGSYATLHGSHGSMPNINEALKPKPNQKQKQQTAVKTHQRYFSCKFTSTSPLKDSRRPSINLERGAINKKK